MTETKIDLDQDEAYLMNDELSRLSQENKETPKVYEVPSWRIDYLKERIGKLQVRARRLGCTEPQVIEVGYEDRPEMKWEVIGGCRKQVPTGVVNRVYFILVEGSAPKFGGWTLIAAIDRMPEMGAGNFVRVVPGQTLPKRYWSEEPHCDHCNTVRNRIGHYVVQHESGETKMVGSSCIKDFLGHVAPENIAALATFWSEIDGAVSEAAEGGVSGAIEYVELPAFLSYVSAAISKYGWLSAGRAYEEDRVGCATKSVALDSMFPPKDRKDHPDRLRPTDEDRALAAKAVAWALALDPKTDFEHNMRVVAQAEALPWRGAGIAAAMIFCYKREVEKELLREKRAKMFAASTYVGEVKERRDFEVTVVSEYKVEGNYGTTHIYKLLDKGGNLLTWFSSSAVLKEGESYVLKGTVKAHEEYKGTKQTVITRCKVVKTLEVAK